MKSVSRGLHELVEFYLFGGYEKERADAGAMEGAAYRPASHGLLSPLSYRTRDRAHDGIAHPGLGSHLLITTWEKALQLDLMEAFLSWGAFFWGLRLVSSCHPKPISALSDQRGKVLVSPMNPSAVLCGFHLRMLTSLRFSYKNC